VSRARRLRVIVEADGGARGNPGPAGYGAVVREAATGEVLLETAKSIGTATNNVAEYSGLIAGLQAAADLGAVDADVRMDSKLVVEQMSGRWQIKHPGLRPLAAQAAALVTRFDTVRFTWVPRERNRRADALASAAIDGKQLPEPDLAQPAWLAQPVMMPANAGAHDSPWSASSGPWAQPSASATRLVLVRHGETELTSQRRYSGRGDVDLTERGHVQANLLAVRLATLTPTTAVVMTSPAARCRQTAEVIVGSLRAAPALVEPDLIECDFGQWEGLTFREVRQRWPQQVEQWLDSTSVAPPGGEAFDEVAARVRRVVTRVLAEHGGKTVMMVSHVTPIKMILRDALGAGDALLRRLYLDPAGISIVDSWAEGAVAVRTMNDTAHLESL
jgi:ribonuclease H / adenosylcobalamin/alpha-ribazole phosphatase